MIIHSIPSGPFATNAIIIGDNGDAAIIDPAPGSAPLIDQFLEEHSLTPSQIVLTHSHWDHTGDLAEVKSKYNIPVAVHPTDLPNVERPGSDGLPVMIPIAPCSAERLLQDGDIVVIGGTSWRVIHTPGHTPGGICLYCANEASLISGDTLFQGSIGNLSFPTADPQAMWTSLDKLAALPQETAVFPGHGPSTTIGAESWLPRARELFS